MDSNPYSHSDISLQMPAEDTSSAVSPTVTSVSSTDISGTISISKRRRSISNPSNGGKTSSDSFPTSTSTASGGKINRKASGTPTPCCTPSNSPEKPHTGSSSPKRPNLRSSFHGQVFTPVRRKLRRGPTSPPTPYSSGFYYSRSSNLHGGASEDDEGIGTDEDVDDFLSGGVSKLDLNLKLAEQTSSELERASAITAFTSGGAKTAAALAGIKAPTGGYFSSIEAVEDRQKRYREMNQARIRNWEKFYGDMDGKREGGEVCRGFGVWRKDGVENLKVAATGQAEELTAVAGKDEDGEEVVVRKVKAIPVKFL